MIRGDAGRQGEGQSVARQAAGGTTESSGEAPGASFQVSGSGQERELEASEEQKRHEALRAEKEQKYRQRAEAVQRSNESKSIPITMKIDVFILHSLL